MTAKQIETELRKIYPNVYISTPIYCIGLPHEDNWTEWWIESNIKPGAHRKLGTGRTPKKAWVDAWNNRNIYIQEPVEIKQ